MTTSFAPRWRQGGSPSSPSSAAASPRSSGRRWREVPLHHHRRRGGRRLRVWISSPTTAPHATTRRPTAPPTRSAAREPGCALPRPANHSSRWPALEDSLGDVGMVAVREIRERVRGRIFRVGTLIILVAVGRRHRDPDAPQQRRVPPPRRWASSAACRPKPSARATPPGTQNQDSVTFVPKRPWPWQRPICARASSISPSSTATRSCSTSRRPRTAPRPIRRWSRTWPSTSAC